MFFNDLPEASVTLIAQRTCKVWFTDRTERKEQVDALTTGPKPPSKKLTKMKTKNNQKGEKGIRVWRRKNTCGQREEVVEDEPESVKEQDEETETKEVYIYYLY